MEDTVNYLSDCVVCKEHAAVGWHAVVKEVLEAFSVAIVRNTIAGIPYPIEDALAAVMKAILENETSYGDNCMPVMIQPILDKVVTKKENSIRF